MKNLKSIRIGKKEVLPLIEGGKGVAISTGGSAGAWGACGGIGTFSGANPDFYNENGTLHVNEVVTIEEEYKGQARVLNNMGQIFVIPRHILKEIP